jgi:hypothetical protein
MTAAPDTPSPWARPLYEGHIDVLGRLTDMGMGIAETIERQVKAAADAGELVPERAPIDFARIARAVRLTVMLQARLIQELEDRDRLAAKDADRAAWSQKCERVTEAFKQKQHVTRIVERIAEADQDDAHEVERLVGEARERLDQDDFYGDILARPVSELIAAICQDLGLDPDWPRLAEEAWARREMAGERPGWPLTGLVGNGAATPIRLRGRGSSP